MTLSEALELYLRLKGNNKDKVFHRGAERNIQSVIDVLGDRPVDEYASSDATSSANHRAKVHGTRIWGGVFFEGVGEMVKQNAQHQPLKASPNSR